MTTLNMTPNAVATHWSSDFVGMGWSELFTCWDLVRLVQLKCFEREMPMLDVARAQQQQVREVVNASGWERATGAPADGDVVLMRGPQGLHVGVVVTSGPEPSLLHNLGGIDENACAHGSVRIDEISALGRLGYGRLELWRVKV